MIKWVILLLVIVFSGCTIPIKLIPYEDPKIVRQEERTYQESLIEKSKKKEDTERDIILQSFNDSGIILKAFEKLGCSIFDIATFLNEYGKSDIEGFCDYLSDNYPFTQWFRWELDKEIFIPAKRDYQLLKRLDEK